MEHHSLEQKLVELLGNAEQLTMETAPKVFADIIFWAQIEWIFPALVMAMFLGIAWVMHCAENRYRCLEETKYKAERYAEARKCETKAEICGAISVGAICGSVILLFVVLVLAAYAIKATVAPYAYLLDNVLK